MRLTISMPCWGRPERTKRSIEAILAQDTHGWEALIGGDKCPKFQKMMDNGYFDECIKRASENGNIMHFLQHNPHTGSCGYSITNYNIKNAQGKYLIFYANDDIILPNHFSHYLEIEGTDYDYMYFNSFIKPLNQPRISELGPSRIGHSEIIVKTEQARKARPHLPKYGHDWEFIYDVTRHGKGQKSKSKLTTYHIMSVPNFGTVDKID